MSTVASDSCFHPAITPNHHPLQGGGQCPISRLQINLFATETGKKLAPEKARKGGSERVGEVWEGVGESQMSKGREKERGVGRAGREHIFKSWCMWAAARCIRQPASPAHARRFPC